jgi:hypothetical protein
MEFRLRKVGVNANCRLSHDDTTIEIGFLNKNEATALLGNFKAAVADLECFLEVSTEKPTVVIHVEGGCLTGVTSSCDLTAILADYDLVDAVPQITPQGSNARIVEASVDVSADEIPEWLELIE